MLLPKKTFFLAAGERSYVSEICARRFACVVCGSKERPGNRSVERFIRELVLFRIDLMLLACAFRVCLAAKWRVAPCGSLARPVEGYGGVF